MEKKCSICKTPKELKEFNKNKARKDGYNTICRVCSNQKSKEYYNENTESQRYVIYKRQEEVVRGNQEKILNLFCESKCMDCGNNDSRVFEFDHVRGEKKKEVSTMLASGYSWKTILKEIEKCDIVCANCHRIRTFSRMNTYRDCIYVGSL